MKAVLDTNVFISGMFWRGECYNTLKMWQEGKYILVTSLQLIAELVKVLKDFKIRLPDDIIKEYLGIILANSVIVTPTLKLDVVKSDPKDNMFIETGVCGCADYIVSQDKHLLNVKRYNNIEITTPKGFNDVLRGLF